MHHARSAVRRSASRINSDLHYTTVRTPYEAEFGALYVLSGIWMTSSGRGEGGYLFAACLRHLTIDHTPLSRRSTVSTPNRDTSNTVRWGVGGGRIRCRLAKEQKQQAGERTKGRGNGMPHGIPHAQGKH